MAEKKNQITSKGIQGIIETLCASDPRINSYRYSDFFDSDTKEDEIFPLVLHNVDGTTIEEKNGYQFNRWQVSIYCFIQRMEDWTNAVDAASEAQVIVTDLFMKWSNEQLFKDLGFDFSSKQNIQFVNRIGRDDLIGCQLTMSFTTPLHLCLSELPLGQLPDVGLYYSASTITSNPVYLTCATLTGCSVIQTIQNDIDALYLLTGGTEFDCSTLTGCSVIQNIQTDLVDIYRNYLPISGGTGGEYNFTGQTLTDNLSVGGTIDANNSIFYGDMLMFDLQAGGVLHLNNNGYVDSESDNFSWTDSNSRLYAKNISAVTISATTIFSGNTDVSTLIRPDQNLQSVTDVGNITTNNIVINRDNLTSLFSNKLIFSVPDGTGAGPYDAYVGFDLFTDLLGATLSLNNPNQDVFGSAAIKIGRPLISWTYTGDTSEATQMYQYNGIGFFNINLSTSSPYELAKIGFANSGTSSEFGFISFINRDYSTFEVTVTSLITPHYGERHNVLSFPNKSGVIALLDDITGGASTFIQDGVNTYTGGTTSNPTVNVVGSPTFSGIVSTNELSATTLSASTINSGSTDLAQIFAVIAEPVYIDYTGGSVATTSTTLRYVEPSASVYIPEPGFYHFRMFGTYNVNATTTGAFFSLSGDASNTYFDCDIGYTTAVGDRGQNQFGNYGGGTVVASSLFTVGNTMLLNGFIKATSTGYLKLMFATEVNTSTSVTLISLKGFIRRQR